jgi:hypothetical protein
MALGTLTAVLPSTLPIAANLAAWPTDLLARLTLNIVQFFSGIRGASLSIPVSLLGGVAIFQTVASLVLAKWITRSDEPA